MCNACHSFGQIIPRVLNREEFEQHLVKNAAQVAVQTYFETNISKPNLWIDKLDNVPQLEHDAEH